jgi:uncharacterized protein YjbI with pentapeptide repeats
MPNEQWQGKDLRLAKLSHFDLSGADLSNAHLVGANLNQANLTGANLSGANLQGARLRSANLRNTNLTGTDIRGADLSGADLTGADDTGMISEGNVYLELPWDQYTYGDMTTGNNVWQLRMDGAILPDGTRVGPEPAVSFTRKLARKLWKRIEKKLEASSGKKFGWKMVFIAFCGVMFLCFVFIVFFGLISAVLT